MLMSGRTLEEIGLKREDAHNRDLFKTVIAMFRTFCDNTGAKWSDKHRAALTIVDEEPLG